jgi:hypothetical protein
MLADFNLFVILTLHLTPLALYKLNAKKLLYLITSKSPLKFVFYPKSKCMTATTFK